MNTPYISILFGAMLFGLITGSCQKMERPEMNIIPDDTARINGPLQLYIPFEESLDDSAQYNKAVEAGSFSFIEGPHGKAYKGSTNSYIQYPLPQKLADAESFTISFWLNTSKHTGGAQGIFALPNTTDFWGNIFAIIEGNDSPTDNSMLLKFAFLGNWIEFNGNNGVARLPDMYGKWKHLAFSYDARTSRFSAYLDGEQINLPESITNRMKDGKPLGPLKLISPSRFVIGGFQQHIGVQGTPDSWMLTYNGGLDQFRVYTKALTTAEIKNVYSQR